MLRINCSLATGSFETQAEAHQLFCWFLLLVSVGQRKLCRWLLMAAVASPYAFSALNNNP
jgi:hypothetical protein